ncbi:MAG: hypothetical protein ACI4Q9_03920 [Candidatus Methanomethylophilaceae archaeon]
MEKNAIIAICVVAVLAVAGGAAGFIILNNNDDNSGDTYWYYVYFEADNPKNGWYSATATNASDGFRNAMDAANMTYELISRGYVGSIDGVSGSWWHGLYLYSDYSADAQNASIAYPVSGTMGLTYSNGWRNCSGYDTEGGDELKLYQMNANVWYLTPYITDGVNYSVESPDKVKDWMNDGPFKTTAPTKTQTYSFYLYFGEDDSRTKWYSASATNASDAFDKAMKDAGFEYEISSLGYLSSIGGEGTSWWLGTYTLSQVDKDAQDNSIKSATVSYGLQISKGWKSFSGYDVEGYKGLKLGQSNSTIWFMSIYDSSYNAPSPTDEKIASGWMNSGPFATA